jgi:hypothetical protein
VIFHFIQYDGISLGMLFPLTLIVHANNRIKIKIEIYACNNCIICCINYLKRNIFSHYLTSSEHKNNHGIILDKDCTICFKLMSSLCFLSSPLERRHPWSKVNKLTLSLCLKLLIFRTITMILSYKFLIIHIILFFFVNKRELYIDIHICMRHYKIRTLPHVPP